MADDREILNIRKKMNMRQNHIMNVVGVMAWLQEFGNDPPDTDNEEPIQSGHAKSKLLLEAIAYLGDVTAAEFEEIGDIHNMLVSAYHPERTSEDEWDISKIGDS